MLVLSRKLGQGIQVGPDVRIRVVRIDGSNVRIGIEAPDGMMIYREEILPKADERAARSNFQAEVA